MKRTEIAEFDALTLCKETTNTQEFKGEGIIPQTIQSFFEILEQHGLENIHPELRFISIYTNYETDENGPYTYHYGIIQSENTPFLPECNVFHIKKGEYLKFTTEEGPLGIVVPKMWQKIWAMTPQELGGERAYTADFELYNPASTKADICIALK